MNAEEKFLLRWRGRQIGPHSLSAIEQQLDDREIGMWHEVFYDQHWISLTSFFVEISRRAKVAEARTHPPIPNVMAPDAPAPAVVFAGKPAPRQGARLIAQGVTKTVRSHASGQLLTLLEDVTLAIEPNEFVALLGPAGSGKSTLIDALNGRRPATGGSVLLNGLDLNSCFEELRPLVGYVPQKDIVHHVLTVQQELTFAARLRLAADTPREQIEERVSAVLEKIGLGERQTTRNADLSGGQLKRVNLGIELLADPALLFLDEATSGQDAGTEARLMTLFRKLASEGKTVVCITHNLENVGLCDLVAVLTAGQLAYYGPPGELLAYFEVDKISEIYEALASKPAAEWVKRYRTTEQHQQFVTARLGRAHVSRPQTGTSLRSADADPLFSGLRQFLILTRRYATVTLQDRRNVLLLLLQAPVIGILASVVVHQGGGGASADQEGGQADRFIAFVLVISAIWFGCFNAVREIVKELPIYLRERAINLSLPAYLSSKVAVLSLLGVIQCLTLFLTILGLTHFRPDTAPLLGMLTLTATGGMMLGLFVSALVNNSEKAQSIAPILLIPQFIFAGALWPLSGLAKTVGTWLIVAFWSLDGLLHTLPANASLAGAASLRGDAPVLGRPHHSWGQDLLFTTLFVVVFAVAAMAALKIKDKPS